MKVLLRFSNDNVVVVRALTLKGMNNKVKEQIYKNIFDPLGVCFFYHVIKGSKVFQQYIKVINTFSEHDNVLDVVNL